MNRLRRLRNDESGMSYVFIGMGMMAFLSASMLAIDVGMLMTSRNQAQNSADAGALAGATALVFDSYDDRSVSGPAVQGALTAATFNGVMGEEVSVKPTDIEFPTDPEGRPNRVKATVYRTAGRGNAVSTLIARFFSIESADIAATATAEASPADGMTCVKPFAIPDKWNERQNPPWDMDDTFEAYDKKSNPLANPDIYVPPGQPGYTGYTLANDVGQRLMIRAGTGNDINPTMYFSIAIAAITGGDYYRENIATCNQTVMRIGEPLTLEPGNMVGPTVQGAWDNYNLDPNAYWDPATRSVRGSRFKQSPRVFAIPLYDPKFYDEGKVSGRTADLKVANFLGFFLEDIQGNNIWGRIVPIVGVRTGTEVPAGAFAMSIRLVQ